ncbi:urotensin II-related peptide [Antennarius striatus]|uniref:urotensin II-related peptide n=1 Tax=Antennarius striatus TaxID=241820 RepID=UPI0035B25CAE
MVTVAYTVKIVLVMLLVLDVGAGAAPTTGGFEKPPHLHPSFTSSSTLPGESSSLNPSRHLKRWLLSAKAAAPGISDRSSAASVPERRRRTDASPYSRAQMLRMISGLEELHRTLNSTLSSRITIMTRGKDATRRNGRNSGRKHKLPTPTTAPPTAAESTASRASASAHIPSLTGRNFKKSLPPQIKKTNKRVCFWKYCSQN